MRKDWGGSAFDYLPRGGLTQQALRIAQAQEKMPPDPMHQSLRQPVARRPTGSTREEWD